MKQDIENKYDEFFGTGYWEKQYKQHIVVFVEQIIDQLNKSTSARSCICQNCNKEYSYDLIIDDNLWKQISPKPVEGYKGGGLLCPECIIIKIEVLLNQGEGFQRSVATKINQGQRWNPVTRKFE